MNQLNEFIMVNWMLVLSLLIILTLIIRTYVGPAGAKGLKPMEAISKINHDNAIVVDVRTDQEFQKGHVLNSISIPLGVIESRMQELDEYKNQPIILSCQSGNRSGRAIALLKKRGFENLFNLTGGMMAWQNANLPVTKKVSKPAAKIEHTEQTA